MRLCWKVLIGQHRGVGTPPVLRMDTSDLVLRFPRCLSAPAGLPRSTLLFILFAGAGYSPGVAFGVNRKP